MTSCIVPCMYKACKVAVSKILKKIQHISFTTDAWRSFNKDSYITITAHVLDEELELHSFVLDTSEMKDRHTSENLIKHITNVLQEWGFAAHSESVTLNFNTTNSENIYAEEEDGVDYLRDLHYYDEEMNQMDMDISQNHMSESHIDDNLHSESENSDLNASAGSISSRSNEHYVINSNFTFISDNASDISKALKVFGKV